MHFLTEQTPKGMSLGLEMISLEFEKETELKGLWEYIAAEWKLEGSPDWEEDENGKVQGFSWMSEPLDGEEADILEKMSEETFGHPMYAMPYLYIEGRIRKDGSVFLYVFSAIKKIIQLAETIKELYRMIDVQFFSMCKKLF